MKNLYFILSIIIASSFMRLYAQDTTWFDAKWNKVSTRDSAEFYRLETEENGKWIRRDYFLSNNQIQMEGTFKLLEPEVKEGDFVYYDKNGSLEEKVIYLDDKYDGKQYLYYPNGIIKLVEIYKMGVLIDTSFYYDEDGRLNEKMINYNGRKLNKVIHYYKNGSKHEGMLVNWMCDGVYTYYDKDGNVTSTRLYKSKYGLDDAGIEFTNPKQEWYLLNQFNQELIGYFFRRNIVNGSNGNEYIGNIIMFIEPNVTDLDETTSNSVLLLKYLTPQNYEIIKKYDTSDNDYPLAINNSRISKGTYFSSDNNESGIVYKVSMITKHNGNL